MQLAVFKYQQAEQVNDFRTIEIDGEPWFVAKDVCDVLGISNARDAISSLDEDEKLVSALPTSGQIRNVNLINESGLYNLIFKSKKESAKRFRKWVTKEVIPSIRKTGGYEQPKAVESHRFVRRFNDNWERVDRGHFSVISELYVRLYAKFEMMGYEIPDTAFNGKEIRPDVSVGKMFAAHIKSEYPFPEKYFKNYDHVFPNGITVQARQYRNMLLPAFIDFIDNVWMPQCAERYFKERDVKALDYLPKLLNPNNFEKKKIA